ncbi:type 2 lanthipeptide synthetase LanM family protein [Actinomadura sp. DC4]|uniref:type 2 lanthipeptide synthetase LanM family protein n=1 Tax=Actinomadura sp. DC4 TaxID=3055069 RepID=UPI0025AF715F|nr:type 2 lanthipeptide synthetase LanM family protein [Actinomadura sp. DC4]MDN3357779.1 type 2 lanthipeptide synthetase LanM family protein [Actinomadura sp. DC4]
MDDWFPWQRATTLAERRTDRPVVTDEEFGGLRYGFWAEHLWVRDAAIAERLGAAGTDLDGFRRLLGERPDSLSERLAETPLWAERLVADLAASAPAGDEAGGFGTLVRPLVTAARTRLAGRIDAMTGVPAPLRTLRDVLTADEPRRRLSEATVRTLVLELNVARVEGRLTGGSREERFADFCRGLADPAVARGIWREYPVLARYVTTVLDRWVDRSTELAGRLACDFEALCAAGLLPARPGTLTGITAGAGDVHRGGRSVAIVSFERARLVYKPRSLRADTAFSGLLDWWNRRSPRHRLRTLAILDRGTYGWAEFADGAAGRDPEAFYWRTGALLAFLYLLSAVDLHFENIIASGDHPVLVDLEGLFQSDVLEVTAEPRWDDHDPAARLIRRSVLATGLLPLATLVRDERSRRHRVDVSGIGAERHQISWAEVLTLDERGTDEMRMVKDRPMMTLRLTNQPTVAGTPVDPADHRDAVLSGFAAAYRLIACHRDDRELLRACEGFRHAPLRAILRPTQLYAGLLTDALHPDFLRDGLDRLICLDRLWNGLPDAPGRARLIESEIAQLTGGDIPLFEFTPDGRDLVGGDGDRVTGVLTAAPYDTMRDRLASLSEEDLGRQIQIIHGAYTTLRMDGAAWPSVDVRLGSASATASELVRAAETIAGTVLGQATREGDAIGWVGAAPQDDRFWTLQSAGVDLYGGRPGIGLFLAYAGLLTGDEEAWSAARLVADGVARDLRAVLEETAASARRTPLRAGATGNLIGGFGIIGGSLYFLAALTRLTGDRRWTGVVERAAEAIAEYATVDRHLDLVGGASGGILALLAAGDVIGERHAAGLAARTASSLLSRARRSGDGTVTWPSPLGRDEMMLTGLSHGASGLAYAFAELFARVPDPRYAEAAGHALAYERSRFDAGNWADLREGVADPAYGLFWCNGAPGIGLVRSALLRRHGRLDLPGGTAALEREAEIAMATTVRSCFADTMTGRRTHSLCHGDVGNLLIVQDHARRVGDDDLLGRCSRVARTLLDTAAASGWSCGVPLGVPTPGLMCGLSGIGLGLLRAAFPSEVPDVLLLQT